VGRVAATTEGQEAEGKVGAKNRSGGNESGGSEVDTINRESARNNHNNLMAPRPPPPWLASCQAYEALHRGHARDRSYPT